MSDNPIYSDFWLEKERYSDYIDPRPENLDEAFSIDLIQLASVRRIISNYVDILTGTSVPVFFKAIGESYNVGGKEIYITTAIRKRKDFDQAVGLALHEAAHTLLTDFDLANTIPFRTPKVIWEFGRRHRISKQTLERFLKTIFNIIEDWYIDDWVISRVPGYVGYYEASYNVCFNTPTIDQILLSNEYRFPSLESYQFRIINFSNPLTDLQALPGLETIAKKIGISTISRLGSTQDRINVMYEVVEIVLRNLQDFHAKYNSQMGVGIPGQQGKPRINVNSFFEKDKERNEGKKPSEQGVPERDSGDTKGDKDAGRGDQKNQSTQNDQRQKTDSDKTIRDIADTLGRRPKQPDDENKAITSQVNKSPDKELPKDIRDAVNNQIQYVHGIHHKKELNPIQKNMLDLIEKHGIALVYVPVAMEGNDKVFKVGCIVVKKLTMDLIEAGQSVFPMSDFWKDMNGHIQPTEETAKAVQKGVQLGTKLGKKLVIRREANVHREIRKRRGKINKRLLFSAGFDAEDIFEKIRISKYTKGSLHITVDASTSMVGEKWHETICMCVAICKATSMVDNIHVTVSFRATKNVHGVEMPYIVQAYDSQKDKFSKVKNLFRFLKPCGCTPEGLAFGAIMDLFTEAVPDEEDRYFLNISDGEPFLQMKSPLTGQTFVYGDGNGVEHTRNQIAKIRRCGIRILSYYVQSENYSSFLGNKHDTKRNFQIMYGRDARFIKTDSVAALAKTINELFLQT